MPDQDHGLDGGDATELGELLRFLDDWLGGNDTPLLAGSFRRFVGSQGYDLAELRHDLAR